MTTLLESYKLPGVAPVRSVFARSNDISVRIGTMIDLSEDGTLMLVDVGGAEYWLPVAPGGYEYGGKVVVEFSGGKPRHVAGAAESGTGNQTVVAHQELIPPAEISAEEKARLEGVEAGLAEAQAELAAAGETLDAAIADLEAADQAAQQTASNASLAAREAHNEAVAAQAAADDALAKYGPLDQRTIAAQNAASAAQARADSAYSLAASKPSMSEVQSQITLSANGKNSITVSQWAASGQGVAVGDLWRRVDSSGNVIAEWTWTGSDWRASMVRSEMITNLDVHKLTVSGTASFQQAVIDKLYAQLIVAKLLVAEKIITDKMLVDGIIEGRHLAIVPETGSGGLKLDAYGMDVVGPDTGEATTFVSFRADQENAISFVRDGVSTFSVSPEGDAVAQSVAANESLTYRGVELAGLLGQLPQGVVSDQVAYMDTYMQLDGTERTALLSTVPARDPALGDRQYKIHVQISSSYSGQTIGVRIRYTEDGTQVKTTSPGLGNTVIKDDAGVYTFDLFHSAPADKELHFRLGLWSSAGVRLPSAGIATHMWVEDLGPAVPVRAFTPSQGSGGGQSPTPDPTTEASTYVREFSPTWTRSYLGSGSIYNYGAGRAYHGYYLAANGILGSAVGFNRTEISAFIGTGDVTKVEVYLQNAHTYSSAGMTAQFGTHSYTSAPSYFSVPAGSQSATFKKGEGKWVTLPSSMWTAWKTGAANGVTLKPSTSSQLSYGYFDGAKTRVRITVRK